MGKRTPLYERHIAAGGKMVDFAGWDMPLHYGSQVEEHHRVRRDAGMFDVSHMTVVDVSGEQAGPFLQNLLANDVARLKAPGKALYTCMLNERGGVIDDLIVYLRGEGRYRLVVNAATRDKDLAWITRHAAAFGVGIGERPELAMLAVQGPRARDRVLTCLDGADRDAAAALGRFSAVGVGDWFLARTGYTGEDGFEIILPAEQAGGLWQSLLESGVAPVGLGARDTLRLEAGMNLYGADMTEETTPLVSGLGWTVAWEPAQRDFIGRTALEAQREAGVPAHLVGLVLEGRGVLRAHQEVCCGEACGEVTSGSFSPTLGRAIALARLPGERPAPGTVCQVGIRGKLVPARVVRPPFVRDGKSCLSD